MRLRGLSVFRLPGFGRLLAAYSINELGDWLGIVALSVLVFDQLHSPIATAALFLGTGFLPALLSPPLVAAVEPFGSRSILASLYALEAAVFLGLALLADSFALAPVVLLATVDAALALATRSMNRGMAAALLTPAGRLREGNALLNIGFSSAAAIGPAVAGVTVAVLGARGSLLLDSASFVVVAIVVARGRALPDTRAARGPPAHRLREALRYVTGKRLLRRLVVAQAVASVFFMAVVPIEVVYAKQTLGVGDTGYGALLASWGAGMVAGSLGFAAGRRLSLRVLLVVSTLAIGCAYLGLAVAGSLVPACTFSVIGGIGNGVEWVALMTAVQELTEARFQARVAALLQSVVAAMTGAGFALGGAVAAIVSARASFLVAGAGTLAVVAAAAPLLTALGARPEPTPDMVSEPVPQHATLGGAAGPVH